MTDVPPPSAAPAPPSGTRVLVTGAAGFVGVNLVRALGAAGAQVVALTRRPPDDAARSYASRGDAHVEWVLGDVTDRARMRSVVADGVTDIVHSAAVTATLAQEKADTARVFEVNAGGTLNLLEAARRASIRRFVFVSSGGLYGPAPPTPALDETTPMQTRNLYGIAKAASERLALRYRELHGFDVSIGRLGTAYGPMERTTGSRSNLSAILQVVRAMQDAAPGRAVRVHGAEIARDFVHIDDAADAFVRLVTAVELPHRIYNVGAPVAEPLGVALDALAESTGARWASCDDVADADVAQTAANARAAMNTERLVRDLGWSPAYGLADGARATLAWYAAHPDLASRGTAPT